MIGGTTFARAIGVPIRELLPPESDPPGALIDEIESIRAPAQRRTFWRR